MNGRIFAIEEFATFDGPGIRTTVFLKGCPLRCMWCHNPEGQSFENELIRNPNGCLGCGACLEAGERLTGERKLVYESIAVCPQNRIRECAEDYTVFGLCDRLMKNAGILNKNGGGVTFSGGEPLAQADFLAECLSSLKGMLHRAVQTSGMCGADEFGAVLKDTDYVLYDLKIIDDAKHRRYTGGSNGEILRNFGTLCESGVPFCVRMPLIPEVTDTTENIEDVAKLLGDYKQTRIELLPYNRMAGGKYAMLGREYAPSFDQEMPPQPRTDVFLNYGITAVIL